MRGRNIYLTAWEMTCKASCTTRPRKPAGLLIPTSKLSACESLGLQYSTVGLMTACYTVAQAPRCITKLSADPKSEPPGSALSPSDSLPMTTSYEFWRLTAMKTMKPWMFQVKSDNGEETAFGPTRGILRCLSGDYSKHHEPNLAVFSGAGE